MVPETVMPLKKPAYKKTERQLREAGLWVEGRMVKVPGIKRRETREEIPEDERCNKAKCANRKEFADDKRVRYKTHATKAMKEATK